MQPKPSLRLSLRLWELQRGLSLTHHHVLPCLDFSYPLAISLLQLARAHVLLACPHVRAVACFPSPHFILSLQSVWMCLTEVFSSISFSAELLFLLVMVVLRQGLNM